MAGRKKRRQVPRNVARRLLQKGAQGVQKVVVVFKNGVPSRVFGFDQYQTMAALPQRVKPWEHRKHRSAIPDPLGAIDAGVHGSLSREDIYE